MIPYLNQPVTNRYGIAKIGTTAVNVSTTDVTFTLPNHAFYHKPQQGYFTLYVNNAIPTGTTTTLPLQLQVNNVVLPITTLGGAEATVADLGIPGTGAVLMWYDETSNTLQIVGAAA